MAQVVLIIGKSGSGKTRSIKNFRKEEISFVNPLKKALPFKTDIGEGYVTSDYNQIFNFCKKTPKKTIVIDDATYLMTREYLAKASQVGYNKFTEICLNFTGLIEGIWDKNGNKIKEGLKDLDNDKIIYILMHEEKNDAGDVAPKTIGKMLDSMVCIEGLFTIVLRAMIKNGKHVFVTQSDGYDVVKTPEEMFSENEIENDLKKVDDIIRDFYNIKVNNNVNESEEK